MTRERFQELFVRARERAIAFAREKVWNEIPDAVRYKLEANQSYDVDQQGQSQTSYAQDSLPIGQYRGPLTEAEAIDFLWRDGRVPEWIDITVDEVVNGTTLIELSCCGRYTDDEERMYYHPNGRGPFGVKGPALPSSWKPGDPIEKFDLHWRRKNN